MDKKRITSRIVAVAIALMVGVTSGAVMTEDVSAAPKTPKKVTELKATKVTKDSIKLQWKKQGKVNDISVKYYVWYKLATSKNPDSKVVKKNTCTIKNLRPGRKYNIKVEAFIEEPGAKYPAAWSKTINVKTKGKAKDAVKEYTGVLMENGVPKDTVIEVLEVCGNTEDVEKVKILDSFKVNSVQIVNGEVSYKGGTSDWGFTVVGNTVYQTSEPQILESATLIINHQEVTVKTGESVKVPNAAGTGNLEIHDVLVEASPSGESDHPIVNGITSEGGRYHAQRGWYWYDNSGKYDMSDVPEGDFDYSIRNLTWKLPTSGGTHMYVNSNHPDINIYWTCDGTEPKIGQEDLYGRCRWTRNTHVYLKSVLNSPDNPIEHTYRETQLRGTTSYGQAQVIFPENASMLDENKFWIKAYANGRLIYEEFYNPAPDGYEVPSRRSDWKEILWEKYPELLEYELETYGPEIPGEL